ARRRAAHGRVLPGPADRPADPAVAVTSASASSHPRRRAMLDACEQTREFALIEAIAAALREELGVAIEEQPGFHDPSEPGRADRAFRVVAATILRAITPADRDLPGLLSQVLGRLARRRLEAGLLDPHEVDHLLDLELDGRDDWLAFLILTDWSEI